MLNELTRPFTETERQELAAQLDAPRSVTWGGTLKRFFLWISICLVSVYLVALFWSLVDMGKLKIGPLVTILGVLASILLGITALIALYVAANIIQDHFITSANAKSFEQEWAPKLRAALDDGQASILQVTSDRVICLEPFDDEAQAYIYDLGDGTCLFLHGQEYYPEDFDNTPWPAKEFELVRTAVGHLFITIHNARGKPEHVRVVEMDEMPSDFVWGNEPATQSILPGTPDEVLARLGHMPRIDTA